MRKHLSLIETYHQHFVETVRERYPMPEPMGERELDRFLKENPGRYEVEWGGDEKIRGKEKDEHKGTENTEGH